MPDIPQFLKDYGNDWKNEYGKNAFNMAVAAAISILTQYALSDGNSSTPQPDNQNQTAPDNSEYTEPNKKDGNGNSTGTSNNGNENPATELTPEEKSALKQKLAGALEEINKARQELKIATPGTDAVDTAIEKFQKARQQYNAAAAALGLPPYDESHSANLQETAEDLVSLLKPAIDLEYGKSNPVSSKLRNKMQLAMGNHPNGGTKKRGKFNPDPNKIPPRNA